jgi:hypothetical protein
VKALCAKLINEFRAELAQVADKTDKLGEDVDDLQDRVAALEAAKKRPTVSGWIDYRLGWAGKQLFSTAEFDALSAKVAVQGQITDKLAGKIALKMVDDATRVCGPFGSPMPHSLPGSAVLGLGGANPIWLDEAYVTCGTDWWTPAQWTAGRQFFAYGLGLLVNDEREPL